MHREEQVVEEFSQIAKSILAQHTNDITVKIAVKGERPSFEELMTQLKELEKELTAKAVKLVENYRKAIGEVPEELSKGLKLIISGAVQQFVKSL